MAFWPRDERNKRPVLSKRRERKKLEKERSSDYPNIAPGLIGAATLLEDENRLKWDFLNVPLKNAEGSTATRLEFGKQFVVFPPSRSTPAQNTPRSTSRSIQKRAEQGANFLRTYLPDVEIASELIRDQLVAETTLSEDLELFDPYSGNLLQVLLPRDMNSSGFLLFPSGETNSDLSITSFNYPESTKLHFRPSATPLYSFPTPIQQLAMSTSAIDADLIVRTYSSVQLFSLQRNELKSAPFSIAPLANFSRADMKGEVIVDVKCLPSVRTMIVVGDDGTAFRCSVEGGTKSVTSLWTQPSVRSSDNNFWRLSLGAGHFAGFVMSDKRIQQFDIRMNSPIDFYSIPNGKDRLTAIEDCMHNGVLPICSTQQIIWMDARFASKPLVAYSHGRQYDRYLSTQTIDQFSSRPLTFLTSRNNGMITVYDISRSVDELVHLDSLPYLVSGNTDVYRKNIGRHFISHNDHLGLARLSEEGSLEYGQLFFPATAIEKEHVLELSKDMGELRSKSSNLSESVVPMSRQEFSQVDLHLTYDALFARHFEELKNTEEDIGESVYQLLDAFPHYLQNKDLPAEHVMTTYDIVFGAGDEPDHTSRADFLSESIIHSKRGYRALKQGHLSVQSVKSPWHRSILPSLQRLDPEFPPDHEQAMEYFAEFNLLNSTQVSMKTRELEKDSCQMLAIDLALSSDIFSDTPILKTCEGDKTLESMTEALSIGDSPPPVQFGHLRPLDKPSFYDREELKKPDGPELPLGVRLLLKDWGSGNPDDYVYQDPYTATASELLKTPKESGMQDVRQKLPVRNQRPPQVLASNVVPPLEVLPKIPLKTQSQDCFPSHLAPDNGMATSLNVSQELVLSTQVLPGPHGGRPAPKKKQAKKRLGGF